MARANGICGIELGKDELCVAHYMPAEDTVTSVAIQPLTHSPWPWWDSVTMEFKPLVREMKSSGRRLSGQRAVCSLPAENAIVAKVMGDSGEEEAEATLRWDLSQQLVGSIDEYAVDFQKLSQLKGGAVTAYLAAAYRSHWPTRVASLMSSHKLAPHAVDLDVFGLVNVFEANYRDHRSAPAILVLGGEKFSKVVLTLNGTLVDFESIGYRIDSQNPAGYVAVLRESIQRLSSSHKKLSQGNTFPVYVSGPVFAWERFADECYRELKTAEPLDPFRSVGCTALPEASMRTYGPRLAVAVGLAVRESAGVGL